MTDSDTEEADPLRSGAGEKLHFENPEVFAAVFAGAPQENLKIAETCLGVTLTARDTWIKIGTNDPAKEFRAKGFLEELVRLQRQTGDRLSQAEYREALNAAAENRPSNLQNYYAERVKVSPRKPMIMPRTPNQLEYLRAMRRDDLIFGFGPAGTGKTYLAMAMAVSELLSEKCDRIILTRPAVEAGENLGFLPGKLEEKINPYLRPLYDALYDMLDFTEAKSLIDRNVIEVAPLAFMRGRTLNNAFIILDEAQNTTGEQMLMFLTRMGFRSTCVVCGDPSQIDLPRRRESGLLQAVERLEGIRGITVCRFGSADVVRHPLVEKIVNAYAQAERGETEE